MCSLPPFEDLCLQFKVAVRDLTEMKLRFRDKFLKKWGITFYMNRLALDRSRSNKLKETLKSSETRLIERFTFSPFMRFMVQNYSLPKANYLSEKDLTDYLELFTYIPRFEEDIEDVIATFSDQLEKSKKGEDVDPDFYTCIGELPNAIKLLKRAKLLILYPTALGICLRRRGTTRLVTQLILKNYMGHAQTP